MNNLFEYICQPCTGAEIATAFSSGYPEIIYQNLVFNTPEKILDIVRDKYGSHPNLNGKNNPEIENLRKAVYKLASGENIANALAIVAPHTHWKERKPVIYEFDSTLQSYIIGCHSMKADQIYVPTSFVFHHQMPLPYEWASTSCKVDIQEWKEVNGLIQQVHNWLSEPMLFGLSIDFRFKRSLFDEAVPSVELPIDEPGDAFFGFSQIVSHIDFERDQSGKEAIEQVAWHPKSDEWLGLNKNELAILEGFRKYGSIPGYENNE